MIFGTYELHKATNEKVLILSLYVNSCSPEGVTIPEYFLWTI